MKPTRERLRRAAFALPLLFAAAIASAAPPDGARYFPPGVLEPGQPQLDALANRIYSRHLRAMSEPVLKPTPGTRSYRFLWLRSFGHPMAARVVWQDDRAKLFATELDGAGQHDPGKVRRRKTIDLTPAQFVQIETLIRDSGFWRLPSRNGDVVIDGAEWIVEGAGDTYHVVVCPSAVAGALQHVGEKLFGMAGWMYVSDQAR